MGEINTIEDSGAYLRCAYSPHSVGNKCEAPFCILITIFITITGQCHAGCSHFIMILLPGKNQSISFYYGCIFTHVQSLMLQTAFLRKSPPASVRCTEQKDLSHDRI